MFNSPNNSFLKPIGAVIYACVLFTLFAVPLSIAQAQTPTTTTVTTSDNPVLETEFLQYLQSAASKGCEKNPFSVVPEKRTTANGVTVDYSPPLECANQQLDLFCRASNKEITSTYAQLTSALSSIKLTGPSAVSRFKSCIADSVETLANACENIKSATQCSSLMTKANSKVCPKIDQSLDGINEDLEDAKEKLKNVDEKISDRNKRLLELKASNLEQTAKLQTLPSLTQNMLKTLDVKFDAEVAKIDSSLAQNIDKLQEQITEINADNIKLVENLKINELKAAQEVNKTTADCKASAQKAFSGLESSKQAMVSSKSYRGAGIGSVLGGNKRFKAMLKIMEKQCLESDTYLEAIKMIQAQKQVALDTLKESQKILNQKIDRLQKLITRAQSESRQAKELMLKSKNNEIEKAQLEMNQALQEAQAKITQNDAEIKQIEDNIEDDQSDLEDARQEKLVAECKKSCSFATSSSGETPYDKASRLYSDSQNLCQNVDDALTSYRVRVLSNAAEVLTDGNLIKHNANATACHAVRNSTCGSIIPLPIPATTPAATPPAPAAPAANPTAPTGTVPGS